MTDRAPPAPEELVRTFSGARSDRVADLLDTLTSLDNQGRWKTDDMRREEGTDR